MQVVLHWGTGDEHARLLRHTPTQVSVDVEGDDAPFVFDATRDGWIERDWGGHAPIRITQASTGRDLRETD